MAWTYSADPGGVPTDLVRLLLGDTEAAAPLCDDAEVAFALVTAGPNPYAAAAWLADRVAAKLARDEPIAVDGISLSGTRTAQTFREMATSLRAEAGRMATVTDPSVAIGVFRYPTAVITGVSRSDMAAAAADPDRLAPSFTRVDPVQAALKDWL